MKKTFPPRLGLFLGLAALMAVSVAAQSPPDVCAPPEYTTGDFFQDGVPCPPQGLSGDFILNRLKNRDLLPDSLKPEVLTIGDLLAYVPEVASQQPPSVFRRNWPQEARDEVEAWECQPAVVEGYLVRRNIEGAEACNCRTTQPPYVDLHVFLIESLEGCTPQVCPRDRALVIEITPRLFAQHPTWTPERINDLAQQRAYVRVTGWRMWDPEHPDQLGQTRGTLWEIHPVHKLEVLQEDGTWQEV